MTEQLPSVYAIVERPRARIMAIWLFVIAAMVFTMVVLGGVTRLTDSGLSMVEWRPITGWLPPFHDGEWQQLFQKYQAYPEFRKMNLYMTLDGFKGIFWLEFLHRLWGRAIGLAFFLPFVFFALRGWINRALAWRFAIMFIGGGLQGAMGWFMVKSGLVDHPDVSQYRLAAHLIIAFAIYAYILWVAISLWRGGMFPDAIPALKRGAAGLVALIFITAFSGALVAGLDAGLTYNTFPLMDGELVPGGMFTLSPVYLNFFENITTVQFDHRVLAVTTFFVVIWFWWKGRRNGAAGRLRCAMDAMAMVVCIQVALGISTLLLVVPLTLAAAHQAGAAVLLGITIWVLREIA
jgi:cytochrome c oxidase assembly protein subunit 15